MKTHAFVTLVSCLMSVAAWAGAPASPSVSTDLSPEQLKELPADLAESYQQNRVERVKKTEVCGTEWVFEERLRENSLEVRKKSVHSVVNKFVRFDLEDMIVDSILPIECEKYSKKWIIVLGHFGLHSRELRVYSMLDKAGQLDVILRKEMKGYSNCSFEIKQTKLIVHCDADPISKTNEQIGEIDLGAK